MKKSEKIVFIEKWKVDNHEVLSDGGLIAPEEGENHLVPLKFFSCIFFSTSGARVTVPFLQRVFQADACHLSFGKYTLYYCYGTTANCNTSLVAFGILCGNEDKEGWNQFWKFAKKIHPSINATGVTIITDQAKGLIESISEVLPLAVQIHCSFLRRQNIIKIVRGGTREYFCLWLFNKLVHANTQAEIDHLKIKHAPFMNDKALKYLHTVDNVAQYPGA
jgi:hypothetical protein